MKTLKTKLILLLLLSQILACGTEKEDPSVIFIIKEQLPMPKPKNEKVLLKYSSVHEIVNLQNLSSTSIQPSLDKKGKKGPTELKIPEGNYRLKISHYAEYQYPNFSENKETIKKQKVILSSKYSFPFRVLNGTSTVAIVPLTLMT